jgi:dolichol-phosphate mannosyltransferase
MINSQKIIVVIPTYKAFLTIKKVVETIPDYVDHIIVVDDKCPQKSGKVALDLKNSRVSVIFHEINQGVGGATVTGYNKALELFSDIVVKMDSDGQMDPKCLNRILSPILNDGYGYSKGNRFGNLKTLASMPKIRLLGNSILSFLVKATSGYWNIMDPTNGYTAITRGSLLNINLAQVSHGYFFESSMLVNLNIMNITVKDVSIAAIYSGEKSSLNIAKEAFYFPLHLCISLIRRLFYKYFLYNFNMCSIYLLLGPAMFFYGSYLALSTWHVNYIANIPSPVGTIMLSIVNIVLGVQFILQAISIDIDSIPKVDR